MKVKLNTSRGAIVIDLDEEQAPHTVENFTSYVRSGHYDGTIFHRVIKGFMIQGGGFEPGLKQKPTNPPIENEASNGLSNTYGTVAMARTGDPHSASTQFFINVKDNPFLDHTAPNEQGWGYCVFGKVVDGSDVVDAIAEVPTGNQSGMGDVPNDDVVLEKAELVEN